MSDKLKKGTKVTVHNMGDGVVKGYSSNNLVQVALYKTENGKQVEGEVYEANPELVKVKKKN